MTSLTRRRWLLGCTFAATLPGVVRAQPALLLATVCDPSVDPRGYLVSEKFDGVRALWDGRVLRFRSGRTVPAPASFLAQLPAVPLDGELWLGRGRFDALSALVRQAPADDAAWRAVQYLVFELPGAGGGYAERARAIRDVVQRAAWPQLHAVEQVPGTDRAALQRRLAAVLAQGGEGLMLHQADAPYGTGRSDVLLKLKPHLDTEGEVIGYRAGQGKYAGQTGALQLQTPQGRRFYLGSGLSDELRRQPPPLGTQVTYRYRDLTATGLPRFASFLRLHDGL